MNYLVEIQPGVSEEFLRAALENYSFSSDAIERKFSVTALAEDHVIVDADALLRLAEKADSLYRLAQKPGIEQECREAYDLGTKIAPALEQHFRRKGQLPKKR